jgi:hypothetical protein
VQLRAQAAYRRFHFNPFHPSLRFKQLSASLALWSARITDSYRAVGVLKDNDTIIWFFIGTHTDYERLLATL